MARYPVRTYYLTPEELAYYRSLPTEATAKQKEHFEREKRIRREEALKREEQLASATTR